MRTLKALGILFLLVLVIMTIRAAMQAALPEDPPLKERIPTAAPEGLETPSGPEESEPEPLGTTTGLSGRVVDESGRGVPGARVLVKDRLGELEPAAATTDEEGRYRLAFPATQWGADLTVGRAGYGPSTTWSQVVEGRVAEVPDVVLRKGGAVRGRVVGPGGEPVAGAQVTYGVVWETVNMAMPVEGVPPAVSAEDGSFEVVDLPGAKLELYASAAGFARAMLKAVALEAGGEVEGLVIHLVREALLRLRVTNDDGTPLAGATIEPAAEDMGNGAYEVHGLPPGTAWVKATKRDHEEASAQPEAGGPEVTLVLARLGRVEVQVVDAETGEPVEATGISHGAGKTFQVVMDLERRAPGRFTAHGLRWGTGRLRAFEPRYGNHESEEFTLTKDRDPEPVVIRAKRLPVVAGTVRDEEGNPVPGALVILGKPDFEPELHATPQLFTAPPSGDQGGTDAAGHFEIPVRRTGTFSIYARAEGFPLSQGPEVNAGQADIRNLLLELTRGGIVLGRAPEDATVSVVHASGRFAASAWSQGGKYRISGVPPGRILVTWRRAGVGGNLLAVVKAFIAGEPPGDPRAVLATVTRGETRVDFEDEARGELAVKVIREAGEVTGLDCQLRRLYEDGRWEITGRSRSDQRGVGDFGKLDPGTYEVTIRAGMRALAYRVFTVGPGSGEPGEIRVSLGTLSVQVLDAETREPLPGATVLAKAAATVEGHRLSKQFVVESAMTDDRGIAVIQDLAPARYKVWGFSQTHQPCPAVEVTVIPDGAGDAGLLELKKRE